MFKKIVQRFCKKVYKFFYLDQWSIQIRDKNFTVLKRYIPPLDRFWADPMLVKVQSGFFILFEELEFKNNKGYLSAFQLNRDFNVVRYFADILPKDFHLSYPHVFEYNSKHYMIPESNRVKTVELYSSDCLPSQWTKVENIMENVIASDTTIFYHDNMWWLFTTLRNEDANLTSFNNLHVFYSESLLKGNWISHPMNPVLKDNQKARSAGPIFIRNEKIIRPSQDCSVRYGYAIVLNEIEELTKVSYREREIEKILPDISEQIGTHTYTVCNEYIATDSLFRKKKFFS